MKSRTRAASNPPSQAGFTLIEVIISLGLLVLVFSVIGEGLSTMGDGMQRHVGRLNNQDMLLRASGLFHKDVANMERLAWPQKTDTSVTRAAAPKPIDDRDQVAVPESKPGFIFRGERERLQFVITEPSLPTGEGQYFISYLAGAGRGGGLIRARLAYHPKVSTFQDAPETSSVYVIDQPYRVRFSYGRQPANGDHSGSWRWFDDWPDSDKLPGLIKLEVLDAASDQPILAPIVARPRTDMERDCLANARAGMCTVNLGVDAGQRGTPALKKTEPNGKAAKQ